MQIPEKLPRIVAFVVAAVISSACSSDPAEAKGSTAPAIDGRGGSAPLGPTGCSMTMVQARTRGLAVFELAVGQTGYTKPSPNGWAGFFHVY